MQKLKSCKCAEPYELRQQMNQPCPDGYYLAYEDEDNYYCNPLPGTPSFPGTPSGKDWMNRFPSSTELTKLDDTFCKSVQKFIDAFPAGHKPHISETRRPLQQQHLIYWAWLIANGDPTGNPPVPPLNPTLTNPPPMAGVDICWVHRNAKGEIDIAASRAAAREMVKGYVCKPADPRGTGEHAPRHTVGRAIDMTISWTGDLVLDGEKIPGGTGDPTKDAWNPKLVKLAKEKYGLTKGRVSTDWPHWSDDGN